MIRRIKPVSRTRKTEPEVRKTASAAPKERWRIPEPGELMAPAVDIYENEKAIILEMELAGVQEKDVKILLYAGRVEVSGVKRELGGQHGARYLRLERGFGAFRRDVPVPGAVDPDKAYASFENGVLTIVLGKPPRKTREVDIRNRRQDGGEE